MRAVSVHTATGRAPRSPGMHCSGRTDEHTKQRSDGEFLCITEGFTRETEYLKSQKTVNFMYPLKN